MRALLLSLSFFGFVLFGYGQGPCDIATFGVEVVDAGGNNLPNGCVGQAFNLKFTILNVGTSSSCTIPAGTVTATIDFPKIALGTQPFIYNGLLPSFTTGKFTWTYNSTSKVLVGVNTSAISRNEGDEDILIPILGNAPGGTATTTLNLSQGGGVSNNIGNDVATATLSIYYVQVSDQPNQPLCNTGSFTMTQTTPALSYTGGWSLISGSAVITDPTSPTTTVTGVGAGQSATLRWTVTKGTCSEYDEVVVTNNELPGAAITNNNGLALSCTNPTTTLTASGNGTYSWSPGGATTAIINVSAAGMYTVTVTSVAGCTSTASVTTTYAPDILAPVISGSLPPLSAIGCTAAAAPAAVTTVAALEAMGLSIADVCTADIDLLVTYADVAVGSCPIVITRTYTITDASSNSSTVAQTINIIHTAPPTEVGGPVVTSSNVECVSSALPPSAPTFNDFCGNPVSAGFVKKQSLYSNTFDGVITLAASPAAGVWYIDRYAPKGFVSAAVWDGDNRLKQSIDATDGSSTRPPASISSFNNTQGRSLDLGVNSDYAEIKMYIPADWATSGKRMAGFWGVAVDGSSTASAYPIVEFTSDGGSPRFRVWESGGSGSWVNLGLPSGFVYNSWVTLKMRLLPSGEFVLSAGSLRYQTTTSAPDLSVRLKSVILQGYNYDATLGSVNGGLGVTYDIYWDDLKWNDTYSAPACEGAITYTYDYTDCAGLVSPWVYTYTIDHVTPPVVPTDGASTVECVSAATAPAAPGSIVDVCGSATTMSGVVKQSLYTNNFDAAVTLGASPAAGVWYKDRYVPNGFVSATIWDGDNRLKQSIDATDGASTRPSGFNGIFYNTQGRKYDLPSATDYVEIKMYIPLDWATSGKRMAGFWGTAVDALNAVSAYPVVEFTSEGTPRFRAYENGVYHDLGLPSGFVYNSWVTLKIRLLPSGEFVMSAGSLSYQTNTMSVYGSKRLTNVILQGYNYVASAGNIDGGLGVTYDIYWDDFKWNDTYSAPACEGAITYTYDYTDCAGLVSPWVYTYTIDHVTAPVVPADGALTVACIVDVVVPTPPTVTDVCGTALIPTGPVVTDLIQPLTGEGTKSYAYTYTDCSGLTSTWTFKYTVDDNIAPVITCNVGATVIATTAGCTYTVNDGSLNSSATDNCTASPVVVKYTLSGATSSTLEQYTNLNAVAFNLGTTTITANAYDVAGNVSTTCTYTVLVSKLTISVATVNVLCNGGNTGSIDVSIFDGSGSYTYAWTGPGGYTNNSDDISGLLAGTYNLTVTDNATGCETMRSVMITESAAWTSTITGNATEAQSLVTSSPITFTGAGGVKPYTFKYKINGDPTVLSATTAPLDNSVTVTQSHLYLGTFTYEVVQVIDANGCNGVLPSPTSVTVNVLTSVPRPDLYTTIPSPLSPSFNNSTESEGYVLLGNAPLAATTTGTIVFRISKPNNFELTIPTVNGTSDLQAVNNGDWIIFDSGSYFTITSRSGTVVAGNSSTKIGFKLKAIGFAGNTGIMTITVLDDTGGYAPLHGDSNNTNNQTVKGFTIN